MMIAMQYSFTLPADYDMSIVERRVQEKGHFLDNHSPLAFKAYLIARKDDLVTRSHENVYAPFYLWRDCEGLRDFISSAGFTGVAHSFGWPSIRSWPAIICHKQAGELSLSAFASREILPIAPFSDLAELQGVECELADAAIIEGNALLALSAFEPSTWTIVRFRIWRDAKCLSNAGNIQSYNVQHVSNPLVK
jgi:hypothetical protein